MLVERKEKCDVGSAFVGLSLTIWAGDPQTMTFARHFLSGVVACFEVLFTEQSLSLAHTPSPEFFGGTPDGKLNFGKIRKYR